MPTFSPSLFLRLFRIGVLLWALIVSAAVVAVCAMMVCVKRGRWDGKTWIRAAWVEYLFIILCIVLIYRTAGAEHRINLLPGHSIDKIRSGVVETYYEKLYNVLLYIPFGALTMLALPYSVRRPYWKVVGIGLAVSLCVELSQWAFKLGLCETDDLICNTAGQAIGALIMFPIFWKYKKNAGTYKGIC